VAAWGRSETFDKFEAKPQGGFIGVRFLPQASEEASARLWTMLYIIF
jgi:hypothetical protein